MADFKLRIIEQGWIDGNHNNEEDMCSHGKIYLEINDTIVSIEEDEWTLSTSGLALLRSAISEHSVETSNHPLFNHCGELGMFGCPISINWDVVHHNNTITIFNITKIVSTNGQIDTNFQNLKVTISKALYIRQIIIFCDNIRRFFEKHKVRIFHDDYSKTEYESFWNEFNRLLEICRKELKTLK